MKKKTNSDASLPERVFSLDGKCYLHLKYVQRMIKILQKADEQYDKRQ